MAITGIGTAFACPPEPPGEEDELLGRRLCHHHGFGRKEWCSRPCPELGCHETWASDFRTLAEAHAHSTSSLKVPVASSKTPSFSISLLSIAVQTSLATVTGSGPAGSISSRASLADVAAYSEPAFSHAVAQSSSQVAVVAQAFVYSSVIASSTSSSSFPVACSKSSSSSHTIAQTSSPIAVACSEDYPPS